jgi:hypothetical protein
MPSYGKVCSLRVYLQAIPCITVCDLGYSHVYIYIATYALRLILSVKSVKLYSCWFITVMDIFVFCIPLGICNVTTSLGKVWDVTLLKMCTT